MIDIRNTPFGNMVWFMGVIESTDDPEKINRVKVRCIGFHTDNLGDLPTEALPWAWVITNTSNMSSPNFVNGDWVVGFFLDGQNAQQPAVFGIIHGVPTREPNPELGFNDPDGEFPRWVGEPTTPRVVNGKNIGETSAAWAKNACVLGVPTAGGGVWSEPPTKYAAEYSKNHAIQTPRFHLFEMDDSRGAERINIFHRKGSFIEFHPDGQIVVRAANNHSIVVAGDANIYAANTINVTAGANVNVLANDTLNIEVVKNANLKVGENLTVEVGVDFNLSVAGNTTQKLTGDWTTAVGGDTLIHTGGNVNMEGAEFNWNDGAEAPEAANTAPPVGGTPTVAPVFGAEVGADDNEDEASNSARAESQAGAGLKFVAPEEVFEDGETSAPSPGSATPVDTSSLGAIVLPKDRSKVGEIQLSKYYKVRDLVRDFDGDVNNVYAAKSGLSAEKIVSNLRELALNILDPLRDAGVAFNINSCFRDDSNSNHGTGCAVDLGFNGISSAYTGATKVYAVVGAVAYQCFLEYSTNAGRSGWLHVAYVPKGSPSRGAAIKPGTYIVSGSTMTAVSRSSFVDKRPKETSKFDGAT